MKLLVSIMERVSSLSVLCVTLTLEQNGSKEERTKEDQEKNRVFSDSSEQVFPDTLSLLSTADQTMLTARLLSSTTDEAASADSSAQLYRIYFSK